MPTNPAHVIAISALINRYRSRPLVAIAECERLLATEEASRFRAVIAKIAARAVSHTLFALDAGDDRPIVVARPRAELEAIAESLAASIEKLEEQGFESHYVENIEAQLDQLAFLPDVDEAIDGFTKRLTDNGEKALAVKAKIDVVAAIEATLALPAPPIDWLGEILAGYTYKRTHSLVMADSDGDRTLVPLPLPEPPRAPG